MFGRTQKISQLVISPVDHVFSFSNISFSLSLSPFLLQGQNGFEELRRYVKQGGDFSKELIFVLQER